MPTKSIFRQQGARHFQVVHRSQRDPLIHDPEASQYVLRPIERSNARKGKSRAELEASLSPSELTGVDDKIGQAALYGIYYDDTEYDYMQHLRPVGVYEDGMETILIEAPPIREKKPGVVLDDLPPQVLPSSSEVPRNYESQEAIPSSIAGFKPDMDPHLRQVLEALEDEAFVDDELEDDFFAELVVEGERKESDAIHYEFQENGDSDVGEVNDVDDSWEARYANFKKTQKTEDASATSDVGEHSEGGDTIGHLPPLSVIGGKRRRKGTSDASGYSMTSSSLFRTEALQTLDERFDQLVCKEYNNDPENPDDERSSHCDDDDEAPELITSRPDFEAMMDDFLDNYEMLGRKLKPKLEGETGLGTLATVRQALGKDDRIKIAYDVDNQSDDDADLLDEEDQKERWDCETILTTYSNLENHPRLIRARDVRPVTKIRLDPKSGLPTVNEMPPGPGNHQVPPSVSVTATDLPIREIIARPREESKDDKKARKTAVKAERQARRKDKKATKEQFKTEAQHQMKGILNKEKPKLRKL